MDDYFWGWLNNDLARWLNDNQILKKGYQPTLRDFFKSYPCFSVIDYIGYYYFNRYTEKQKCAFVLNAMTLMEYVEFYKFMWDVLIIISKGEYEMVVEKVNKLNFN